MNLLLVLLAFIPGPGEPAGPYLFGKPGAALERSALLAESTHAYDVRHYRLDFDLPMTNAGYACREEICLASRVPALDTVVLDFDELVCDSVRQLCEPLAFSTGSGLLTIELSAPLPEGDSTVLELFFRRESTARAIGWYYSQPPRIRYAHGMTCGCPTDNHYWFACWDHPMDKSDRGCMMNLTLPDTFQTCANGLCDSVTDNGNGTRTWWWNHHYPIAPYLMTFSASRFASWDTWFVNTGPSPDTIPIRHWMWPEDSAITRTGYARLPEMMAFYTDTLVFGAYPFDKFGHVPGYFGFPWGGMEHQTLVMLHASYIGGGHESTIAHELSHMWWGDMVTHVGYADVWLNEGFATYSECICMGALNGRAYFNSFIRGKASSYISRDRTVRMPIYDPPWHLIYDYGHIYCKGAWVQHMLRWVMGDTAWDAPGVFFEAQRAYGDSFRYGTVSTDDYQRVVEQFHGEDLDWFFDEWVYQAGYPKYHLDWRGEPAGDSFLVITTLAQQNGAQAPDFFRTPLPVRVNCAGADTLVAIWPAANPQTDTFKVAARPESLVVDPDNWVLDSCYLTGIAEGTAPGPRARLLDAGPNPARGRVRFQVSGPAGTDARVEILDKSGRRVAAVGGRVGSSGRAVLDWSPNATVPAGVYFCRLAGAAAEPVKLVLLAGNR